MVKVELIERGGSLWKDRARELQLRIRDRFRVAVDLHTQWQLDSAAADYSVALRRWIHRLLKDPSAAAGISPSSSSSFKFYRKKVQKDVDVTDDSILIRMLQAVAVPVIGNACHLFMRGLNHVQVYGAEKLHWALLQRPDGQPLITVSNHVAAVDDPLVISSLLPPRVLANAQNLRWTLCASDRCFTNPVFSAFFRSVKVLPVSRGEGIYQKGMDMALSKLNNGGWVHIFPEGSRSKDGGITMGTAKRGVGRLVIDADTTPMVVPFVHTGMQEIMPIGANFPKIGKTVTVLIGDPIFLDDLFVKRDDPEYIASGSLYDAVSSRIGQRLQELKVQVERLALEQLLEARKGFVHEKEHGCKLWQQVDWEAFGMGNYMPEEYPQIVKQRCDSQAVQSLDHSRKLIPARTIRMGISYEGSIVSRVRGYMDPSEFMGFAARGLFMKGRLLDETRQKIQQMDPLNAWKQFLDGNVFRQWSSI